MAGVSLDYAATELEYVARNLRQAAQSGLLRELERAISDAAQPILAEVRSGLDDHMPNRYAGVFGASLRVTTSKRLSARDTGVTIRAAPTTPQRKVKRVEAGLLSHPVWGDRERWVTQTAGMKPGFFSDPAKKSAPRVREAIIGAMERVAEEAGF